MHRSIMKRYGVVVFVVVFSFVTRPGACLKGVLQWLCVCLGATSSIFFFSFFFMYFLLKYIYICVCF